MNYAPRRGDLVWLDFSPQAGHEQGGRRPALVLSPESYNRKSGLSLVCPVTHQSKGYPYEVPLGAASPFTGVVLADHIRNVDWRARRIEPAGVISPEAFRQVRAKLATLLAD